MVSKFGKQGGFSLIEVVAAAALIGIMATMLMPSLAGANDRVKNAKLHNDLASVDQAIQVYRMEKGTAPTTLKDLDAEYLSGKLEFKDAKGIELTYTVDADGKYILSGSNSKGETVNSPGSKVSEAGGAQ